VSTRRCFALAAALTTLALAVGCGGEDGAGSAAETSAEGSTESVVSTEPEPEPVETVEELPDPVAQTRAAILAAARARDYDALAAVIDPEVFLSDAGFGVDPVPHWRELGTAPLEAMETLLGMLSTVEETNEGTLYRWPRFTANSHPDDMSGPEREALTALLGEDGLRVAFQEEYGYVAPRLGILADGTWWFLVLEAAP
jgi:hypothetical protein